MPTDKKFKIHFKLEKCEILHYEPKGKHNKNHDVISEFYQYCPHEFKFTKKCIIELHIKRIKV